MLGKLLKYEFRDMAKKMMPLYGVVAALAVMLIVVDRSGAWKGGSTLMGIMSTVFIVFLTAMMTVTIVTVVQRFRKSLLGDEAYFMLTLPVTKGRHIWSKAISASVWMTISTMICILVGVITTAANVNGVQSAMTPIDFKTTAQVAVLIAEFALFVLLIYALLALKLYASMAAGSLTSHFGAASCGAFIAFTIIETVIVQLLSKGCFTTNFTIDTGTSIGFNDVLVTVGEACVVIAVWAAVYYLVTWLIMEKKAELR